MPDTISRLVQFAAILLELGGAVLGYCLFVVSRCLASNHSALVGVT